MFDARSEARFVEPPWFTGLSAAHEIAAIPPQATIAGMYLIPLVEAAKKIGRPLPSARARYTAYSFYPLREHAQLLIEGAEAIYPDRPLRLALRKLGRGATGALLSSTLGKVVLSAAVGPAEAVQQLAKTYSLNLKPGHGEVLISERGRLVVELRDIYYFLDCHHVGVMEGILRYAGVDGEVRINSIGRSRAEYLLTWK